MHQIKCESGYEIQVLGKGENAPCRVENQQQQTVYTGTYAQCLAWLAARAVRPI